MKRLLLAVLAVWSFAEAVPRAPAVRAEFHRLNPCPSTGRTHGACPGYQADHKVALICGGLDEPANLQWLTVEEHKAKTIGDVKLCQKQAAARP